MRIMTKYTTDMLPKELPAGSKYTKYMNNKMPPYKKWNALTTSFNETFAKKG